MVQELSILRVVLIYPVYLLYLDFLHSQLDLRLCFSQHYSHLQNVNTQIGILLISGLCVFKHYCRYLFRKTKNGHFKLLFSWKFWCLKKCFKKGLGESMHTLHNNMSKKISFSLLRCLRSQV